MNEKYFPKVGEKLYLQQKTGSYYIDLVKRPYTVIGVTKTKVYVQSCELIFNGPAYYDTLADDIIADTNGCIEELTWHPKHNMWATKEKSYPQFAHFGQYKYYPYLD